MSTFNFSEIDEEVEFEFIDAVGDWVGVTIEGLPAGRVASPVIAVLLLGLRVWSWRSHGVSVP